MRLEYLLLADKAEAINGKLYLLGGGLDTVRLVTVPALASYDVALSVRFSRPEVGNHQFDLSFEDNDGKLVLGPLGGQVMASEPGERSESRVILIVNGPFPVAAIGKYRWSLKVDGQNVAEVPVEYQTTGLTADQIASIPTLPFSAPTEGEATVKPAGRSKVRPGQAKRA